MLSGILFPQWVQTKPHEVKDIRVCTKKRLTTLCPRSFSSFKTSQIKDGPRCGLTRQPLCQRADNLWDQQKRGHLVPSLSWSLDLMKRRLGRARQGTDAQCTSASPSSFLPNTEKTQKSILWPHIKEINTLFRRHSGQKIYFGLSNYVGLGQHEVIASE